MIEINVKFTESFTIKHVFRRRFLPRGDAKIHVSGGAQARLSIEPGGRPSFEQNGFNASLAKKMADGGDFLLVPLVVHGIRKMGSAQPFENGWRRRRVPQLPPRERSSAGFEQRGADSFHGGGRNFQRG